jgi:hypothetical protein
MYEPNSLSNRLSKPTRDEMQRNLKIPADLKAKGVAIAIRYNCVRWSESCGNVCLMRRSHSSEFRSQNDPIDK